MRRNIAHGGLWGDITYWRVEAEIILLIMIAPVPGFTRSTACRNDGDLLVDDQVVFITRFLFPSKLESVVDLRGW